MTSQPNTNMCSKKPNPDRRRLSRRKKPKVFDHLGWSPYLITRIERPNSYLRALPIGGITWCFRHFFHALFLQSNCMILNKLENTMHSLLFSHRHVLLYSSQIFKKKNLNYTPLHPSLLAVI